jgi:hypothetical protein
MKHHRLRPSVAAIVISVLLALRMIVLGEMLGLPKSFTKNNLQNNVAQHN